MKPRSNLSPAASRKKRTTIVDSNRPITASVPKRASLASSDCSFTATGGRLFALRRRRCNVFNFLKCVLHVFNGLAQYNQLLLQRRQHSAAPSRSSPTRVPRR